MRILVVTVDAKCPAAYALRAEGWNPDVRVIEREDIYAYGRTLHEYWQDGEGFINVEHDMAPWEGAIQALWDCALDDAICLYGYPRAQTGSMGLTKFSETLIRRFPNASERWPRSPWNMVESSVLGKFKNVAKHQHRPNVGHLSGWFTQ